MGVGDAQGLAEEDGDALARAEALAQRLVDRVSELERVIEGGRERDGEGEVVLEALALRQCEGVADGEVEADATLLAAALGDAQGDALGEKVGDGVGEAHAEAVAGALGDALAAAAALAMRVCEALTVSEGDAAKDADGQLDSERVPLTVTVALRVRRGEAL